MQGNPSRLKPQRPQRRITGAGIFWIGYFFLFVLVAAAMLFAGIVRAAPPYKVQALSVQYVAFAADTGGTVERACQSEQACIVEATNLAAEYPGAWVGWRVIEYWRLLQAQP